MPEIPIANGTTSITIECATLTVLQYSQDDILWRCQFSNWAYGLFAICLVFVFLISLLLIIKCAMRYCRHKELNVAPDFSRQTSHSSFYGESTRDLHNLPYENDNDDLAVLERKPKRIGKLYYPYPAYGTYDDASLFGSANSLRDVAGSIDSQRYVPIQHPHLIDPASLHPGHTDADFEPEPLLRVSSSVPSVSESLRNTRGSLCDPSAIPHVPVHGLTHSLIAIDDNSDTNLISFQEHLHNNELQHSSQPSVISTTTTISDEPIMMNINGEEAVHSDREVKSESIKDNVNNESLKERASSNLSLTDKDRILSATPVKNMITRQDFDDYLADCVLKLPEGQRNGTFLIRSSTTSSDSKVLTMYCKSEENSASLYYFKIRYTDKEKVYLENTDVFFQDLDELIRYHQNHQSILPCYLGDCLGKNF